MRIGYCSPFPPLKTGIADFSKELVLALAPYMELVLFSPMKIDDKTLCNQFECHLLRELDSGELRESLDLIVYHVGNHSGYHGDIVKMLRKYPGVTELHDVSLHNLGAEMTLLAQGKEAYQAMAKYCHGTRGLAVAKDFSDGVIAAPWDNGHTLDMCMNRPVIEYAQAVIVHSSFAKQMILGQYPDVPITSIMLHSLDIVEKIDKWQKICRMRLGINSHALVIGSFGFATHHKRIIPILDALKRIKEEGKIQFSYYIVGECEKEMDISTQISTRGLEGEVHVTGFTSLEDFACYMGACDFCLNLRYPTQGETSASLHRMLGMGKPAIVTDVGSFADYPDEVALKVSYGANEVMDIYMAICTLVDNKQELRRRSKAALAFARENCDIKINAVRYRDFFEQLIHHTWRPDHEDLLVGRLCELGLTDEAYIQHFVSIAGQCL